MNYTLVIAICFCIFGFIDGCCRKNRNGKSRLVAGTSIKTVTKDFDATVKDIKDNAYDTVMVLGYNKGENISTDLKQALSGASYTVYTIDSSSLLIATRQKLYPISDESAAFWNENYERSFNVYEYMGGKLIKDETEVVNIREKMKLSILKKFKEIIPKKPNPINQGVLLVGTEENFELSFQSEGKIANKLRFKGTSTPSFLVGELPTRSTCQCEEKSFWQEYKTPLIIGGLIIGTIIIGALVFRFWQA